MGEINLSNSSGRDAHVELVNVASGKQIRWLDDQGRQASSVRVIKSTVSFDYAALIEKMGVASQISQAIIDEDPEIDVENAGRFLRETSRVFVDKEFGIVRNVRFWETIKNPDGSIRERRPRQLASTNISGETPLKWSGVFIPKSEAIRKFAFSGKSQIQHVNGLTYDFLFAMAKELHERDSLMLLGAGSKSNQPLILRRGGTPYRGFLEGRISEDAYCLVLHYSNLELKVPASDEGEDS